jgi:hypothetical protein
MKHIFIGLIRLYQYIPGPWHNSCRHVPTCSNYAIEALKIHGTIKGLKLGLKRLSKCNPWGTMGIDKVPKKEKK